VQRFVALSITFGILAAAVYPAGAAFSSMHIFGDGVSTTTNNPLSGKFYYGLRRSNGRVWVELLAQRQGLGANSITNVNWSNSSNNWSYYYPNSPILPSSNLVLTVSKYAAPADAQSALFVVWVNDADFVNDMANIYPSTNIALWAAANNQSLTNHYTIITNLYAKGVRTLVMPNAVDITEIPDYSSLIVTAPATRNFIRQQVINFDAGLVTTLDRAKSNCPSLAIYSPDFFNLLDSVLTNAATYGLTNALSGGVSIDAISYYSNLGLQANTNGLGTNFIFWDSDDPTAKFHEIIADVAQQTISPVWIGQVTPTAGGNQLDIVNVPVGLNGSVVSVTDLFQTNWTTSVSITSTNTAQSVFVTNSGAAQFYRLRFPYAWRWP
jgi:phospholipase/lecithinase/hemolysin